MPSLSPHLGALADLADRSEVGVWAADRSGLVPLVAIGRLDDLRQGQSSQKSRHCDATIS